MIVIVRHGNTFETGEPARRIGAGTDLPLTRRGEQQAEALGRCFADKGWNFARILASPLQRTWQTAEAIAACQSTHARIEQALSGLRQILDEAPAHDDHQQHGAHRAEGQQHLAGQITEDDQTGHSRVVRPDGLRSN